MGTDDDDDDEQSGEPMVIVVGVVDDARCGFMIEIIVLKTWRVDS